MSLWHTRRDDFHPQLATTSQISPKLEIELKYGSDTWWYVDHFQLFWWPTEQFSIKLGQFRLGKHFGPVKGDYRCCSDLSSTAIIPICSHSSNGQIMIQGCSFGGQPQKRRSGSLDQNPEGFFSLDLGLLQKINSSVNKRDLHGLFCKIILTN